MDVLEVFLAVPSDPELVARCVDGEDDAWSQLVERYSDFVYGIARRSGLDGNAAGDVVQDVFFALCKGLRRLRQRDRLMGWIAQTARRESWRAVRRRTQVRKREEAVAAAEQTPAKLPATVLGELEDIQTVREAYGAIGERCRRLLDLLFVAEDRPPYADIGEQLGMAVGSIGPTRKRCLAELRTALEALGFQTPEGIEPGEPA